MQPINQTANVLADNEAPYSKTVKYGKMESSREEMLSEAFGIISNMSDKQFEVFLYVLRKELQ